MNIDRLYAKYCIHKNNSPDSLIIDKAGFTQAIAEIISNPVEAVVKPANGGKFFGLEIINDREGWWYDGMIGKKFNARQATDEDMREAQVSRYDAKDCYAVIDSEFNRYIIFKEDSRLSV